MLNCDFDSRYPEWMENDQLLATYVDIALSTKVEIPRRPNRNCYQRPGRTRAWQGQRGGRGRGGRPLRDVPIDARVFGEN